MAESKTKVSGVILSQNYAIKGLIIGGDNSDLSDLVSRVKNVKMVLAKR